MCHVEAHWKFRANPESLHNAQHTHRVHKFLDSSLSTDYWEGNTQCCHIVYNIFGLYIMYQLYTMLGWSSFTFYPDQLHCQADQHSHFTPINFNVMVINIHIEVSMTSKAKRYCNKVPRRGTQLSYSDMLAVVLATHILGIYPWNCLPWTQRLQKGSEFFPSNFWTWKRPSLLTNVMYKYHELLNV